MSYDTFYEGKKDINKKTTKFTHILGIMEHILKPKRIIKCPRLEIHNTLTESVLLFGSEIWKIRKKDMSRKRKLNSLGEHQDTLY